MTGGWAEALRRWRQWCGRAALSLAFKAWRPSPAAPVRRVLVVEMTRLGDLVAATALLAPLRRAYPQAQLGLVADAAYAPLFGAAGPDEPAFQGLPRGGWAFARAAWRLRRGWRDPGLLLVVASPAVRNSLVAWLARPGRACGYLSPRAGGLGYDAAAPLQAVGGGWQAQAEGGAGHLVQRAGAALAVAGFSLEGLAPALTPTAPRDPRAVLLHAGANWDRRRWPLERFAAVAQALAQRGYRVTLLPAEGGPLAGPVAGVTVVEGLGLDGLKALLSEASLYIGNDSGPLHLAAALGTPCLALFGPNLPARSGPWPLPGSAGSPHAVLEEDAPCRPCDQRVCVQPWDWCLGRLGVERVLAAALSRLDAPSAGGA